uniref:Uncharacterized protein n=1 Tax=Trypanosoma congolense (strain IL3000) TaxID=1068625 RepID=G0UWC6_TRYCI|nr:conserved hypothetical protein [Trypanosoma congolense IL3000]
MGLSWVMLLLIAAALSSSAARKEVVAEQISTLDHGTGESIRVAEVSVGTLASSYDIVGLWPHGGHYEDDALFFNEEDAVYDQWITKKREQRQNQQRKEKQRDKTGAGGATGSASSGSFKKATFSDLTYSAVKSRAVERRRVIKGVRSSNSSSYDAAWGVLLQDAERLRGLLSTASLMEPGRDKESSPEAQYVRLLSSAFRHTTRNLTMETGDSLMATWFSALPFPVILNGDTLLASEQEVRAITTDLQAMRTMTRPRKAENASEKEAAGVIDVEGTALMVEAALKSAATIVAASKNAHRIVSKLVMPVITHAKDTIHDQLRHVEQEIRSNDESTVAKRREIKEMTKFKKMIKSTRDMIFTADNELRNVFTQRHLR